MSQIQDIQNQKSYKYLYEVEKVGQDILTAKSTKLELSNAQNKLREAIRAAQKSQERRTWINIGSVYIERPTSEIVKILKLELSKAVEDLQTLEESIKDKASTLRDLEHEARLEGFRLKPMSYAEAKSLHKGFGYI